MPKSLKQSTIFSLKKKRTDLSIINIQKVNSKKRESWATKSVSSIYLDNAHVLYSLSFLLNSWKKDTFVPFSLFPEAVLYLLEWISTLSSHFRMTVTDELSHKVGKPELENLWGFVFWGQRFLGTRRNWDTDIGRSLGCGLSRKAVFKKYLIFFVPEKMDKGTKVKMFLE